jgi:hypothetical protein
MGAGDKRSLTRVTRVIAANLLLLKSLIDITGFSGPDRVKAAIPSCQTVFI